VRDKPQVHFVRLVVQAGSKMIGVAVEWAKARYAVPTASGGPLPTTRGHALARLCPLYDGGGGGCAPWCDFHMAAHAAHAILQCPGVPA